MPLVFAPRMGHVVLVPDAADSTPLPFALSDWGGAAGFKAIVTDVRITKTEAVQATTTFSGRMYADVFGPLPGSITVAGTAFSGACDDGAETGVEYVSDFYDRNRASVAAEPLEISLGATGAAAESGYLVGLQIAANQTETKLATFSMTFVTVSR